ncbi:MAG: diaminopimelate decarboxylase [Marinilabiliales bacterium]
MENTSFLSNFLKQNHNTITQPLYLYDIQRIEDNCNKMKNCINYADTSFHYATMANSNVDFLKIIKKQSFNVFVNSLNHLKLSKKCGFKPQQIIFTASSLDEQTIDYLHDNKILLHLDSINQLDYWAKKYPGTPVGIRCNPVSNGKEAKKTRGGYFLGKQSRLGLTFEEIINLKHKELICSLHIYVGTDILDVDYFFKHYKKLADLAVYFPNLRYLDFGGGFGVDEYQEKCFDFDKYGEGVDNLMKEISLIYGQPLKLILEPGRIIGSNAGYYITKIIDTKDRFDKQVVVLNSSIVQFPRPLFYGEKTKHPVYVFDKDGNIKTTGNHTCMLVGCSTYSRDIFIDNLNIGKLTAGDFVVFGNSGAYCSSSYTQFLGFNKPKEIFI